MRLAPLSLVHDSSRINAIKIFRFFDRHLLLQAFRQKEDFQS